ncbi:hypothetical protein U8527_00325 [Kordia algicida OT-1]|uniref:Repeat protein (TIGR03806 family) n=1 Tax=Kordia algicida OT-1 TaxID=391587 RepID=A9DR36_9FLAO|nr:hypothetical protein [Kordia algicida]EDP96735.1 hypothetical protein KAOT1_16268 [Kordia algicida OT-1]
MNQQLLKIAAIAILSAMLFSCGDDNDPTTPPTSIDDDYVPIPTSPVVLDMNAFPFSTLSEYNFFEGEMKDQEPVLGVIPYEPISTLFTDYAKKKRFVWMPENVAASYVADSELIEFPVGTILIKTFYYENVLPANNQRIIETRLMLKKADDWYFADYVWNDEQTEATFSLDGSFTNVDFMEAGEMKNTNYRIPSEVECFTCHKQGTNSVPIGVKPQNLNSMFDYDGGTANQLQKLIDEGYLEDNLPATINTVVKWSDETQPIDLRVRSYIDINCAHCHSELSHCDYRPVRFAFDESADDTNLGVCVDPDEEITGMIKIVTPSLKERSVMYYRLNTTAEEFRMPLLGRSIIHKEAVSMIGQWIDGIDTECE